MYNIENKDDNQQVITSKWKKKIEMKTRQHKNDLVFFLKRK